MGLGLGVSTNSITGCQQGMKKVNRILETITGFGGCCRVWETANKAGW